MSASCAIIIPIYRDELEPLEEFSLAYSLRQLRPQRNLVFIAPTNLDASYYTSHFPGVAIQRFDKDYFSSIEGYNRLLLNPEFYEYFASRHEFMLILQTDAILLRDDLDHWCSQPWDYVGAPWPDGLEVLLNLDCFGGEFAKRIKVHVGNGGLSLRRNAACSRLLKEFPQATEMFLRTRSSEDLYFSLLGAQSMDFKIPNERVASLFALELQPERYVGINGGKTPMGGHAWWRYNQPFWVPYLDTPPPVLMPASGVGVPVLSANEVKL